MYIYDVAKNWGSKGLDVLSWGGSTISSLNDKNNELIYAMLHRYFARKKDAKPDPTMEKSRAYCAVQENADYGIWVTAPESVLSRNLFCQIVTFPGLNISQV